VRSWVIELIITDVVTSVEKQIHQRWQSGAALSSIDPQFAIDNLFQSGKILYFKGFTHDEIDTPPIRMSSPQASVCITPTQVIFDLKLVFGCPWSVIPDLPEEIMKSLSVLLCLKILEN
jgi:hypothetical protein